MTARISLSRLCIISSFSHLCWFNLPIVFMASQTVPCSHWNIHCLVASWWIGSSYMYPPSQPHRLTPWDIDGPAPESRPLWVLLQRALVLRSQIAPVIVRRAFLSNLSRILMNVQVLEPYIRIDIYSLVYAGLLLTVDRLLKLLKIRSICLPYFNNNVVKYNVWIKWKLFYVQRP